MKFKRQIFGFMDMLRFKKLVPNRRKALANGAPTPLPTSYKTNEQAKRLHPGYMTVELVEVRGLTENINEYVFKRVDSNNFPFFRAGQYVALQVKIGSSLVTRPYSIVSSPNDALNNRLVLAIERIGLLSNYMADSAKVGDTFIMTEPSGEFHFETLRDNKNVVCIAGGSGITPFMSMAKAVIEKNENFNMTLFYGVKTLKDLAYKNELDAFASYGIKVIYVLSDDINPDYEHGFVSAKLLKKYVDIKNASFFLCGPQSMYKYILDELKPYELPIKAIHKDASCCQDLDIKSPKQFTLKVKMQGEEYTIPCMENETLLVAMERAGINAPSKCRAGGCGFCHSKLISGEYMVAEGRDGRRAADKKFNYIHPCVTYPKSDIEIDVPIAY